MPDDIEYITFKNDEVQTTPETINGVVQPQYTAYVNGTVEVDYTTNTVTTDGAVTVSGNGTSKGLEFSAPLTQTSSGTYEFATGGTSNNPNLEVQYQTQAPTQASGITYNSDPGQPDNMEYFATGGTADPLTSSTTAPVCFVTGTAITTARGPVAVEHLAIGDRVLTSSGAYSRIRWIGHRTLDCRRNARPAEIMPVRIAAHAFGANRPSRDLLVSPGHAICVDVGGETLIPAGALINGTSIVQQQVETVTYWHVELEGHDILLAENLPCESYLDMGNRGFFVENGVIGLGASPDAAARTHADFCRPFHASGAIVAAVRGRLAARAAASAEEAARVAA